MQTVIKHIFQQSVKISDVTHILLGSLFIALCAQVQIPLTPYVFAKKKVFLIYKII